MGSIRESASCHLTRLMVVAAIWLLAHPGDALAQFKVKITTPAAPKWARPVSDALAKADPTNPNSWPREKMRSLDPGPRANEEVRITAKHFSKGVAEGLQPMLDTTIDRASERMKETVDHATDRFAEVLSKQTQALDEISKNRMDEFKGIMDATLGNASTIADEKLKSFEGTAQRLLGEQERILDKNVTRIESMLQSNVERADRMLDESFTRMENLQADSFARLDGVLQDQVPYAAGQVAQQFEVLFLVLVFFAVLVGVLGYRLLVSMREAAKAKTARTDRALAWHRRLFAYVQQEAAISYAGLRHNLAAIPQTLIRVGIPMLIVAGLIHLPYRLYCHRANVGRVNRLVAAAEAFEAGGDFKSATSFRRRALAMSVSDESRYFLARDAWLADYAQKYHVVQADDLVRQLLAMQDDPSFSRFIKEDQELGAVRLYLALTSFRDLPSYQSALICPSPQALVGESPAKESVGGVLAEGSVNEVLAKELDARLGLIQSSHLRSGRAAYFGRLLYMAKLQAVLNSSTRVGSEDPICVADRINEAEEIANEMSVIYPNYAPGLLVSGYLSVLKVDAAGKSPKPELTRIADHLAVAQAKLDSAYVADPTLARLFSLALLELETPLAQELYSVSGKSTNPNARQLDGATTAELEQQLDEWVESVTRQTKDVFSYDPLAKAFTERVARFAIRRSVGQEHLGRLIAATRPMLTGGDKATDKHAACIAIVREAGAIDRPDIADYWLVAAEEIVRRDPTTPEFTESEFIRQQETLKKEVRGELMPRLVFLP